MKQISRILEEVNHRLDNIRLVKCLAVHNEEDWITYNLKNNYDEFDIIRVVEGAVEGRPNSTEDGHSTDKTLKLIRNFPDPDNKIELYMLNRPFKSLEEQKQIFLEVASEGDWLVIVDCDEFYMEGDIDRIRNAIKKHPAATEFIPTFLHFYRDFFHLRATHPVWNTQHQRCIRYQEGLKYHTHPVATDAQGKCTYFTPEYQPTRYTIPNLYVFHYGHAKGHEFHKMKSKFYTKELAKFGGQGGNASIEFDAKLDEFINYTEDLSEILYYDGEHPEVLDKFPYRYTCDPGSKFWKILDNKKEPTQYIRNEDIKLWKDDKVYSKDKLPNIVVWMEDFWGPRKMQPFYNLC